jgi:hypothetical protein
MNDLVTLVRSYDGLLDHIFMGDGYTQCYLPITSVICNEYDLASKTRAVCPRCMRAYRRGRIAPTPTGDDWAYDPPNVKEKRA